MTELINLDYENKIFETIKKKTRKELLTVDTMIEGKSYQAIEKIINAIKALRDDNKIYIVSCTNNGRFENRILVVGEDITTIISKKPKIRNSMKQKQIRKIPTKKMRKP